jgi:raffinose/stachyose/melibiose transport system substrate-binding protein
MKRTLILLAATFMGGSVSIAYADSALVIESWRNDDLNIWQDTIIPAFEKAHPDIKVTFQPTAPTEYDGALSAKLDSGTAGDLITCRPFDKSLQMFQKNQLSALNDLSGMGNFSAIAKVAWTTDDGKSTFCVPMAAVIHGFFYNKDAFKKLGIQAPATWDEFFADADKIKKDGTYTAVALGTPDQWEAGYMGYLNIGPNYWKGEDGRLALIKGTQKLTDAAWVEPMKTMARMSAYMGDGYKAQSYPDSQNLFELGRAAIYPTGSWEISGFRAGAKFELGVFPPPVLKAGDPCYITDHDDIALGLNANSKNKEAAKVFLSWVASAEFAALYANALPGFFSLSNAKVELKDPLAQEFVSWRGKCKSTIRATYQILSRGKPTLDTELGVETSNVVNGTETPEAAMKKLQDGLASWYAPQKN